MKKSSACRKRTFVTCSARQPNLPSVTCAMQDIACMRVLTASRKESPFSPLELGPSAPWLSPRWQKKSRVRRLTQPAVIREPLGTTWRTNLSPASTKSQKRVRDPQVKKGRSSKSRMDFELHPSGLSWSSHETNCAKTRSMR